jgi:hypothetical protein
MCIPLIMMMIMVSAVVIVVVVVIVVAGSDARQLNSSVLGGGGGPNNIQDKINSSLVSSNSKYKQSTNFWKVQISYVIYLTTHASVTSNVF